jgi:hypothetical protein
MNLEELLKEIESLKKQREEMIANVNAIGGAIQFAEQLVAKMNAPKAPENEVPVADTMSPALRVVSGPQVRKVAQNG